MEHMSGTVIGFGHYYRIIEERVPEERVALDLYRRLRGQALWGRLWSGLSGRNGRLLTLAEVEASGVVVDCRQVGTCRVPISQIRGSNCNRCCDFDVNFRPLHSHEKERWLGVAAARLRGVKLPPVDLIEVAGVYFVVDGHHRISVARALGVVEVQASVTSWQVAGPLPWEKHHQ
jgi:hypothetical protein